jgi:hypothetical protein
VLFHLFQFALQRAARLLPHRTATVLVTAGAAKVGMGDQRVAWLAGGDGDLHERSPVKTKRPGAVTQPGPFDDALVVFATVSVAAARDARLGLG